MKIFGVWVLALILIAVVYAAPVPDRRGSTEFSKMPYYVLNAAKDVAVLNPAMKILEYSVDNRKASSVKDYAKPFTLRVSTPKCEFGASIKNKLDAKCFLKAGRFGSRWCEINVEETQKDKYCLVRISRENK